MWIMQNEDGEVEVLSYTTVEKNEDFLFPHMIDITDIKNPNEIYHIVMEYEKNLEANGLHRNNG